MTESWRAVEIFSPQPLPRPDARFRVADVGAGEPLPWEPASRHCAPPPRGKAWRHEVFGGIHELGSVRDTLTRLYGPDDDGGQREPAGGQSALFAVTVDGDGVLVAGTAVLSSCAWAVGQALAARGDLSLAGFSQDARLFGSDLARLAGADDDTAGVLLAPVSGTARGEEPAGAPSVTPGGASGDAHGRPKADRPEALSGEPADLKLRPLRGEDLRRFAARLADQLGVTEALRPRGLRVRAYLVDADRADEQTVPSWAAKEKVEFLAAERTKAALALSRLPALRRDAATVYASITAAEDTLRALASQRVAAERSLRAACHRHQAAAKALAEHARARPGLRASLSTRFRARQDWRARQGALDAARRDRAALVSSAQRAIAEIQAQFAATVRARAEAAATLRRLTAECAAAQEAIERGAQRWGERFPSGPKFPGAAAD